LSGIDGQYGTEGRRGDRQEAELTACLGGACYDVYLNDVAYWRCIAAIPLLEPALDTNYELVKADTYSWPGQPRSRPIG